MTSNRRALSKTLLPCFLLGAVLFSEASCVENPTENSALDVESLVRVRPRLVIDGLSGLAERTDGRLFVDRVAFHTPSVHIQDKGQNLEELLSTDPVEPGPLLFWYDIAENASGGAAWGGERYWRLGARQQGPTSRLLFEFGPLAPAGADFARLEGSSGKELTELAGHTAFIHGYVVVEDENGTGFRASSSSHNSHGGTASGHGSEDASSGDPEGDPASGDPEGDPASGDPEGDPASGDPEGDPASGDPEGDPASGDPEGDPALGDPEGDPADALPGASSASGAQWADEPTQTVFDGQDDAPIKGRRLVPFLVVLSANFALPVPMDQLAVNPGNVDYAMPINLHVDVNGLFSSNRLESLDRQVRRGSTEAVLELGAQDLPNLFELALPAADPRTPPRRKLHVTGDSRDER